jgi:hypothetical protein
VWSFVNSFSFIFLEFLVKIYWANFFSWATNAKKGDTWETDWTGPRNKVGWPARSDWPKGGPVAVRPSFSPECSFSTSFFGHKILREV